MPIVRFVPFGVIYGSGELDLIGKNTADLIGQHRYRSSNGVCHTAKAKHILRTVLLKIQQIAGPRHLASCLPELEV